VGKWLDDAEVQWRNHATQSFTTYSTIKRHC